MKALKIGDLNIPVPIIQGGMGVCVSMSGLASAVANEGGVGVISAVGIGMSEPDYRINLRQSNIVALKKEIRKAREKSKGVIGVNIMMAVSDFEEMLKVAIEELIDIVFVGAGLPLKNIVNLLEGTKTKFVPKVSSSRAAKIIFKHWSEKFGRVPDAIVVEGPLAGGHLGYSKNDLVNGESDLATIAKSTVEEMSVFEQKHGIEIPVIAGGGIYTGKDMYEIMQLGVKGVKIGTRFVTTFECDVAEQFKQNYINCKEEDITLIDSPVGLPGRVITNEFVKQIQQGMQKPVKCPWRCLRTCDFNTVQFCIAEALYNASKGDFEQGFSFAGSKAYLAEKIISVKETINQIKSEYLEAENNSAPAV